MRVFLNERKKMEYPLVSCIMPTKNRRKFAAQSLRYFEEQDYPNKELIIVDDGDDLIVDLASQRPNVHYLAPQYAHTVGVKRNIACEAAHGDIICHWDDDDWYSPSRLSYQVELLAKGEADITGLHLYSVLDLQCMQGWQCTDITEMMPGVDGMHYGTAVYWKHLWMNKSRFHDSPKGDDGSGFVRRLINHGARVYTLPCVGYQAYVRHGRNIWQYRPGESIGTERWHQVEADQCIPQKDLGFYKTVSLQLRQEPPLVSPIKTLQKSVNKVLTRKIVPFVLSLKR
jgi:glycosyltransferase involved in cell wall biosynthesis